MFVELMSEKDQAHPEMVIGYRFGGIARFQLFGGKREINIAEIEVEI
jgi:hypothetical protein